MDTYTESLENKARDIHPEDDIDYGAALGEVVKMFRNFDEALDAFIVKHGFNGDRNDVEQKIGFIKSRFEQNNIPLPRNIRKWYTQHKRIKKETAIRICFAFCLTVEESEEFMRRICLLRGFDCHKVEEVICFYAISNGLGYTEAKRLLETVPRPNPERLDPAREILYTATIITEVKRFKSSGELIRYLSANIDQFGYNNATAYKYIRRIWKEIAGQEGLAADEKKKLYRAFDDPDWDGHSPERTRRNRNGISGDSLWEIYLQILGLSGNRIARLNTDRSLKPILKDNELLHAWAEDSFPSRGGLEKILNGEHVSEQLVHKTIILLVFYRFWVKQALKSHSYQAKAGDTERCICEIDSYLVDTGYPELYPGDPFDWIILHAVENEFPLLVLREYMQELFYVKERDIEARYAAEWS